MKQKVYKPKQLQSVSFDQFKSFLDSLDEENETWSLNLQDYKDEKDFYENEGEWCIVWLEYDKIISLIHAYTTHQKIAEVSRVVKKEYQRKGFGTEMLLSMEDLLKDINYNKICSKQYIDNIASYKSCLKAGYKVVKEDTSKNLRWLTKEI